MTEIIHPVLPLRDIVIFPHMIAPLFVGRLKSINALESVMENNKEIGRKKEIEGIEKTKEVKMGNNEEIGRNKKEIEGIEEKKKSGNGKQ